MKVTETINIEIDAKEALAVLLDYIQAKGYKVIQGHFDYGCDNNTEDYPTHKLTVQVVVEKKSRKPRR